MKQTLTIVACIVVISGVGISSASAQQPPPTPAPTETQPTAQEKPPEKEKTAPQQIYAGPVNPDRHEVKEMGRATPLPAALGPLRWGLIYLRSLEFFQMFGVSRRANLTGNGDTVASVFQGTFAFDKQFKSSRVSLQYRPNITIGNGKVYNNLTSHDVQFDTGYSHPLSRRWTMNLLEGVTYRSARNQFSDPYFATNALTGTGFSNSFLTGPVSYVANSTSLILNHPISPRTYLSFGPDLHLIYSTGGYQQNSISSSTYGGNASLQHALSPTRSVGLSYGYQRIVPSRTYEEIIYQNVTANYSQQFSPSWQMGFSVGASIGSSARNKHLSGIGSFNLSKTFQKSSFTLNYFRGHAFSGYINNGETQRADLVYSFTPIRRLSTQIGGGYENTQSTLVTPGAPPVKVSGTYGTVSVNYPISRSVSWLASFTYRRQNSRDLQVFPGNQSFALTGISWNLGQRY